MSEEPAGPGEEREAPPARPPRRGSPLWARSPLLAVLASTLALWLLSSLWPDVAYFASSRDPIDLGAPGAYRLDAARENRLVHLRGPLVDAVAVTAGRTGAPRTVGRIAGTNLLVDKPGPPGGVDLYEGRLLPAARRDAYGEVAQRIQARGTPLGDRWMVLRDGERPRRGWLPVLGAALLLFVLSVNVRALLRSLLLAPQERR